LAGVGLAECKNEKLLWESRAPTKPRSAAILGTATPGAKEEFPGLQAADLLAYPIFQKEGRGCPEMSPDQTSDAKSIGDLRGRIIRVPLTASILTERKNRLIAIENARRDYGNRRKRFSLVS
jgi:hypothetical protein